MRNKIIIGLFTVLFTAVSCNCTKDMKEEASTTSTSTSTNGKTPQTKVPTNADLVYGTVVYSDVEGDCAYTIKMDDGRLFDPINMDEAYQKDGMKVAFKFAGLRMLNRCTKANPIRIEMMKAN